LKRPPFSADLIVVGDLEAMRAAHRELGLKTVEPYLWSPGAEIRGDNGLAVMNIGSLQQAAYQPGQPTVEGADSAYRYIVEACRMALAGEIDALVTAPINKEWLNRAGHHFPGHSELLAEMAGVESWRMMFAGQHLRVALATVHVSLLKAIGLITTQRIYETVRLLDEHLRRHDGIARPRIGVLGLNPHAGENGLFGDEEERAIKPAIRLAADAGVDAFGPLAPDTAFVRRDGRFGFDGAVAMYHDQGLIPLKTLDFDCAVNITLGLPFVRTSPDHGTAYELAGRGTASATSMLAAITYAEAAVRSITEEKAGRVLIDAAR
jgi:4-hydroxythreonine-4-phosphate dehydrogenase